MTPPGDPLTAGSADSLQDAFDSCERLAKSHYENFSLGTRLLPRDLRRHFYAIYAFCRGVDDLGDEIEGDRLASLNEWERQLRLSYDGTPDHPYFLALRDTISQFDIPREPFLKLIEANRRDQAMKRHPDYRELLDYCDHSANPVGRIVLYLFGHRAPELHALSDHTCTALQLANFWQDVARDYAIGRIYIPLADMASYGVDEGAIASGQATEEFRRLMKFQVGRTKEMFRRGYELVDMVIRPARIDLALFTAGGLAVLRAIEQQDYDVLSRRPSLSKFAKARLFASAYLRSRAGLPPIPARRFK
ncbi:MAG: squalene synthase HpnC [Dehalococcoidia bacterium]